MNSLFIGYGKDFVGNDALVVPLRPQGGKLLGTAKIKSVNVKPFAVYSVSTSKKYESGFA